MRITKKTLLNRLSTFAAVSGQRMATSATDKGGLMLSSGYGFYSIEKISNDRGGVSELSRGTAAEVNAWMGGAIYAFDRPRRVASGFEE